MLWSQERVLVVGCLVLTILALVSIINRHQDPDACIMTYGYPDYIKQTAFGEDWNPLAKKYNLYLYKDRRYDFGIQVN